MAVTRDDGVSTFPIVELSYSSIAGSTTTENQDYVLASDRLVCVLDGVTPPPDGTTGCVHGVRWYVETLAHQIVRHDDAVRPLADVLADAVTAVRAEHLETCDLRHPDTPSAAVAIVRFGPSAAEYLVLCDCAVILDREGAVEVVTDATDPGERRRRMSPTGPLWKASIEPKAAYSGVSGSAAYGSNGRRLHRVALVTDGASRAVELLGLFTWPQFVAGLHEDGVAAVLERVRAAERAGRYVPGARPPTKRHDDATAVLCEFG